MLSPLNPKRLIPRRFLAILANEKQKSYFALIPFGISSSEERQQKRQKYMSIAQR